jgi:hypothetical protein
MNKIIYFEDPNKPYLGAPSKNLVLRNFLKETGVVELFIKRELH